MSGRASLAISSLSGNLVFCAEAGPATIAMARTAARATGKAVIEMG